MLSFLGKIWKGKATVIGVATAALGAVGMTQAAQDVVHVSEGVSQIVLSAGTILAVFGVGRKSGYAANP